MGEKTTHYFKILAKHFLLLYISYRNIFGFKNCIIFQTRKNMKKGTFKVRVNPARAGRNDRSTDKALKVEGVKKRRKY